MVFDWTPSAKALFRQQTWAFFGFNVKMTFQLNFVSISSRIYGNNLHLCKFHYNASQSFECFVQIREHFVRQAQKTCFTNRAGGKVRKVSYISSTRPRGIILSSRWTDFRIQSREIYSLFSSSWVIYLSWSTHHHPHILSSRFQNREPWNLLDRTCTSILGWAICVTYIYHLVSQSVKISGDVKLCSTFYNLLTCDLIELT